MRKFLIAATILVPFAAFAGQDNGKVAGNLALTASGSLAGVQSQQGTMAGSMVGGNGAVINGAVAGNYTSIDTSGTAHAGQGTAKTETKATQLNVGGAITGGYAEKGWGFGNTAGGTASAMQGSQAVGGSAAVAADLGGFVQTPKPNHPR
jgi:hypothetical protein